MTKQISVHAEKICSEKYSSSKMTKRENKLKFLLCQFIFHSFCISGLLWQITQISVNFFKFDTIKDINVFTPEDLLSQDKIAYICFYFRDEPTWTRDRHHFKKLNFSEKFRSSRGTEHWFAYLGKAALVDELIGGIGRNLLFPVQDNC